MSAPAELPEPQSELPEIPQRQLRNNVSGVLREVRSGHSYTITVDGAPVADLIPHRRTRRRTAVPRDEVLAAFVGLSPAAHDWAAESAEVVDDSIFDPYDRAHRLGQFAPGESE
ncbi:prevent-host-death family protein [Nocardia amikacinitolerans]|uniref:Prevent-host-death family protein n=1 Tax=Nocardia amikacinitolerans TaxID=756689 RepID=A0A285L7H2_9NOCA|nr:type II toxin-antitoxin system prevent-host-death family antitoxin [Nocardia amikacinitolerans]SNY80824.1 prevent-host-death family protein [Nocardia amikacinitolerans]